MNKDDTKVWARDTWCVILMQIYQSTEKRKATTPNLYISVILPINLSKRGARRSSIRVTLGVSFCLFFRCTFSFLHYRKSEVKGNGGRASLRNNRASRDRELWQNFTFWWNFCYTMWDRLQWRRNVIKYKVWMPIVS